MMVNVGLFSRLEIRVQGWNIIRTVAEKNCIYLVNKMTSLRRRRSMVSADTVGLDSVKSVYGIRPSWRGVPTIKKIWQHLSFRNRTIISSCADICLINQTSNLFEIHFFISYILFKTISEDFGVYRFRYDEPVYKHCLLI